ncbi:hypothetical protein [Agaribacter flavus]|uniref:Porin n=1 Tax=Agaribacter flavus TaxID=1902781 RepID=A0ABV7FUY7_9ALTE
MDRVKFSKILAASFNTFLFTLVTAIVVPQKSYAAGISGRIEAAIINSDDPVTWQKNGTGILRAEDNGVNITQTFLKYQSKAWNGWSFKSVLNAYADGEKNVGITQAYVTYKPLSASKIKHKARIGFFYPEFSVENTAAGWLSPYFFTQSAINSWYGEELRTAGAEFSWYSLGRQRKSPWTWEFIAAAYKGNDTLATILPWRGFAFHDRQSLHHDRILFAPIPGVISEEGVNGPAWTEPFKELDGRVGFYLGAHFKYLRKTDIRYYFYDNQADPNVVNEQRLYGWRTKFHSLALQHNLNKELRVFFQLLDGSTDMGKRVVSADFSSYFIGFSWRPPAYRSHRLSARYDWFDVDETDNVRIDPNNSDGQALTLAWRYSLSKRIEIGLEWHLNQSDVENRVFFGQEQEQTQTQSMVVVSHLF